MAQFCLQLAAFGDLVLKQQARSFGLPRTFLGRFREVAKCAPCASSISALNRSSALVRATASVASRSQFLRNIGIGQDASAIGTGEATEQQVTSMAARSIAAAGTEPARTSASRASR